SGASSASVSTTSLGQVMVPVTFLVMGLPSVDLSEARTWPSVPTSQAMVPFSPSSVNVDSGVALSAGGGSACLRQPTRAQQDARETAPKMVKTRMIPPRSGSVGPPIRYLNRTARLASIATISQPAHDSDAGRWSDQRREASATGAYSHRAS